MSPGNSAPAAPPAHGAGAGLRMLGAVARKRGLRAAQRLSQVRGWLEADLGQLEAAIEALQDRVHRPGAHLLGQRGKRVRPLCVMLASRLGGRTLDPTVRDVALAGELVHAATLLHDDVIDEGTWRRGAAAARVVYGNAASVLAGDNLLVEALRLVHAAGDAGLMSSLLQTMGVMVDAEVLQLARRGTLQPDEGACLEIIRGKTAVLFAWCLEAGGRLGGLEQRQLRALHRVGSCMGVAFQLVDDVIDLEADPSASGKDALNDLREGKLTWPLLVATRSEPAIAREIELLLAQEEPEPERIATVWDRVRATDAIERTRAFARARSSEAVQALSALPAHPAREAMHTVIETVVERTA